MIAGWESPGGRRSSCVVDERSWWANARLATGIDRAEPVVEIEERPWLNGGEATAELDKSRPNDPTASRHISRVLPSLFIPDATAR
jgi:hypothetical protein